MSLENLFTINGFKYKNIEIKTGHITTKGNKYLSFDTPFNNKCIYIGLSDIGSELYLHGILNYDKYGFNLITYAPISTEDNLKFIAIGY